MGLLQTGASWLIAQLNQDSPTPVTYSILSASPYAVIECGGAGFSLVGTWGSLSGGYDGTYKLSSIGTGNSATWQISGLAPGLCSVQATWVNAGGRGPTAVYEVYDGTELVGTVTVNQQLAPSGGLTVNGTAFAILGSFTINSGTLNVVLTASSSQSLAADSVLVTPFTVVAASTQLVTTAGSYRLRLTEPAGGFRVVVTDRSYVFPAAALVVGGVLIVPQPGHLITEVDPDGVTRYYTPMSYGGGEKCYRYADQFRTIMRMHTKAILGGA
jgi:hypothetical protein